VLRIPSEMPPGIYTIQILHTNGQILYEKKDVFIVIPPNWVAGVQTGGPIRAGGQGMIRVVGRDFSDAFSATFGIETDEPGISIKNLRRADDSTLLADITVQPQVAPGDYWLHLSAKGQKIKPPFGSIIKIEKP
jgi:hypothetical protein